MPGEGLANDSGGVTVGLVVDRQMQRNDRVTAVDIATIDGERRIGCRSLGVGLPVPCEGLADLGGGVAVGLVVHCQMQCDNRVATVDIAAIDGERRGGCGCLGVSLSMPGEGLADHSSGVAIGLMIHRQV